uniref:Uncharacterized protein n=1 Tax=viral metagenome TaxID=1070528 RepID=A0A6C0EXI8_9ZZZZ
MEEPGEPGEAAGAAVDRRCVRPYWECTLEDVFATLKLLKDGAGSKTLESLRYRLSVLGLPATKLMSRCLMLADMVHDTAKDDKGQSPKQMGKLFEFVIKQLQGENVFTECLHIVNMTAKTKSDRDALFMLFQEMNRQCRLSSDNEVIQCVLPRASIDESEDTFGASLRFLNAAKIETLFERCVSQYAGGDGGDDVLSAVSLTSDNAVIRITKKNIHGKMEVKEMPVTFTVATIFDAANRRYDKDWEIKLKLWLIASNKGSTAANPYPEFEIDLSYVGLATAQPGSKMVIKFNEKTLREESSTVTYTITIPGYEPYSITYRMSLQGPYFVESITDPGVNFNTGKGPNIEWFKSKISDKVSPRIKREAVMRVACKAAGDLLIILCLSRRCAVISNDRGVHLSCMVGGGLSVNRVDNCKGGVSTYRYVEPDCRKMIRGFMEFINEHRTLLPYGELTHEQRLTVCEQYAQNEIQEYYDKISGTESLDDYLIYLKRMRNGMQTRVGELLNEWEKYTTMDVSGDSDGDDDDDDDDDDDGDGDSDDDDDGKMDYTADSNLPLPLPRNTKPPIKFKNPVRGKTPVRKKKPLKVRMKQSPRHKTPVDRFVSFDSFGKKLVVKKYVGKKGGFFPQQGGQLLLNKISPDHLMSLLNFVAVKVNCYIVILSSIRERIDKALVEIPRKDDMNPVVKFITLLQSFIVRLFDFLTSVMKREGDLDFRDDIRLQNRLSALLKWLLGQTGAESVDDDFDTVMKKVDEILTQCEIILPVYKITQESGFVIKCDFDLLTTLANIVKYFNGIVIYDADAETEEDANSEVTSLPLVLDGILEEFKVIYAPLIVAEGAVGAVGTVTQRTQIEIYNTLVELLKNHFENPTQFVSSNLPKLEKMIWEKNNPVNVSLSDEHKYIILNVYLIPALLSLITDTLLQQGYFSLDLEESIIKALCSDESEADIVWSLFQKEFRYNGSYIARIAVIRAFISKVEFTGNRVAYTGNIDELLLINSHIDDKLLLKMEFARVSLGEVIDDISKGRVVDATSKDAVIRETDSLIKSRKLGIVRHITSGPGILSYNGHIKQLPSATRVATGGRGVIGGHINKIKTKSKYGAKRRVMYKKFVSKYIIKADKRGNRGTQGGKRRSGANVTRRKILKRSRVSKNNVTRKNNKIHKIHKIRNKKNTNLHYNLHKRHKTLKR